MANESATNNVLYFPYISVPSSVWFTRMLLYWDKVGSIVPRDYPWYDVESETADDYMCYLATALGRLPDLQFTPVTDQVRCLNSLAGRSPNRLTNREIAVMRLELLEETLPAPSAPLKASEIQLFKNRHGGHLTRFRRSIELELTNLASYTDPHLRETRLALIKDQMREEVADIRSKMRQHGWTKLVLGNLCGLLAAIPGMSPVPKLINAVYKAFGDTGSFDEKSPLAYAAYADKDLLDRWRRRIVRWRRSDS